MTDLIFKQFKFFKYLIPQWDLPVIYKSRPDFDSNFDSLGRI